MLDANPYKSPEVTEPPPEQNLESLSDQKVKRLYMKSYILRRFTFLPLLYSFVFFALSPRANLLVRWPIYSVMVLFAVFSIIAFIAAHHRPSWGRHFCFAFSALALLLFPVGTFIGIILILNLVGAERLFGAEKISYKCIREEKLRRKYRAQLKTKPRTNIS